MNKSFKLTLLAMTLMACQPTAQAVSREDIFATAKTYLNKTTEVAQKVGTQAKGFFTSLYDGYNATYQKAMANCGPNFAAMYDAASKIELAQTAQQLAHQAKDAVYEHPHVAVIGVVAAYTTYKCWKNFGKNPTTSSEDA